MSINWDKLRDTLIPCLIISGIISAGIISMILGVKYPQEEWIKNISFFIFGTGTSPLLSIITYYLKGTPVDLTSMGKKMLIAGAIGTALSFAACNKLQPNTTMDIVYENGKVCVETKSCVDIEDVNLPELLNKDETCQVE